MIMKRPPMNFGQSRNGSNKSSPLMVTFLMALLLLTVSHPSVVASSAANDSGISSTNTIRRLSSSSSSSSSSRLKAKGLTTQRSAQENRYAPYDYQLQQQKPQAHEMTRNYYYNTQRQEEEQTAPEENNDAGEGDIRPYSRQYSIAKPSQGPEEEEGEQSPGQAGVRPNDDRDRTRERPAEREEYDQQASQGFSPPSNNYKSSSNGNGSGSSNMNPLRMSSQDAKTFNQFSMTACEKIDLAVRFITSLDFEEHFQKTWKYYNMQQQEGEDNNNSQDKDHAGASSTSAHSEQSKFYAEVYLLQMIVLPFSIAMLLFGCTFFYPTCILCAAAVGLLGVFDVVEKVLRFHLDCPMKLALSVVAAFLCAVLAVSFFRFGLFCFGSVSVGGTVYVLMDSFPQYLDPGIVVFDPASVGGDGAVASSAEMVQSVSNDLSPAAWIIIVFSSVLGGMLLRYYEQATLELMTAFLGGVGCAYSIHTFLLLKNHALDPALVFLLAFFLGVAGWRFQRYRRLKRYRYDRLTMMEDGSDLPSTNQDSAAWMASQRQQQLQLQQSMQNMLQMSHNTRSGGSNQEGTPSSEQISELTTSINRFLEVMEKGQASGKSNKES